MAELKVLLRIEPLQEGGYVGTSPDVPALVAEGSSIAETVKMAQRLARKLATSHPDLSDLHP